MRPEVRVTSRMSQPSRPVPDRINEPQNLIEGAAHDPTEGEVARRLESWTVAELPVLLDPLSGSEPSSLTTPRGQRAKGKAARDGIPRAEGFRRRVLSV